MIKKYFDLKKQFKNGYDKNCYILCGTDEMLIKESIDLLIKNCNIKQFPELNLVELDGKKIELENLINYCETLPFMENKKVIVVYNANFLKDRCDSESEKVYKGIVEYLANVPKHCILILYYIYENDREKPSKKLTKLSNKVEVIFIEKLKGQNLQKRVSGLFLNRNVEINKSELSLFCSCVDNNFNIIVNEVEKLCSYCNGKNVTKEDILAMMPQKSENDIFNLVDYISQKKVNNALTILSELLYRGEKVHGILFMIERQLKLLFNINIGLKEGKNKDVLSKELKIHPYLVERMIKQSNKFSFNQLKQSLNLCIETEKKIKSSSSDLRIELELLIINSIMAK